MTPTHIASTTSSSGTPPTDQLPKRARATLHERFVRVGRSRVNRERDREQEFEEILGYHLEQAFRYRA